MGKWRYSVDLRVLWRYLNNQTIQWTWWFSGTGGQVSKGKINWGDGSQNDADDKAKQSLKDSDNQDDEHPLS
jgi:hypothetical protein